MTQTSTQARRCSINDPGNHGGGGLIEKEGALICERHLNPVPYCMVEADSPHGGGRLIQIAANSFVCPNHTRPTNPGLVKAMDEIAATTEELAPDFGAQPRRGTTPRRRKSAPRRQRVEDPTESLGYLGTR